MEIDSTSASYGKRKQTEKTSAGGIDLLADSGEETDQGLDEDDLPPVRPELPAPVERVAPRGGNNNMVVLSAEAQAIIAAINNGPLARGPADVRSEVGGLRGSVNELKRKVDSQDDRIQSLETKLRGMEMSGVSTAGSAANSGTTMGPLSSGPRQVLNPYQAAAAAAQGIHVPAALLPFNLRKTLVFGGWPADSESQLIKADLDLFANDPNVVDRTVSGKYNSIGKVTFNTVSNMWVFIKARAGGRLPVPASSAFPGTQVWFSIEKSDEEREISKKVSFALSRLKPLMMEKQLLPGDPQAQSKHLPADFLRGVIWFKPQLDKQEKFRIIEKDRKTMTFKTTTDFLRLNVSESPEDFIAAVNDHS